MEALSVFCSSGQQEGKTPRGVPDVDCICTGGGSSARHSAPRLSYESSSIIQPLAAGPSSPAVPGAYRNERPQIPPQMSAVVLDD